MLIASGVCVEGLEGPPPWSLYPRISIFKMAGDLSPAGARPRAPRRDGPATSFGQRVELPARHCVPGRGLSAGGRGLTKIRESRGWADAYRLRALEFIDWGRGPANGRVNTTLTESRASALWLAARTILQLTLLQRIKKTHLEN